MAAVQFPRNFTVQLTSG